MAVVAFAIVSQNLNSPSEYSGTNSHFEPISAADLALLHATFPPEQRAHAVFTALVHGGLNFPRLLVLAPDDATSDFEVKLLESAEQGQPASSNGSGKVSLPAPLAILIRKACELELARTKPLRGPRQIGVHTMNYALSVHTANGVVLRGTTDSLMWDSTTGKILQLVGRLTDYSLSDQVGRQQIEREIEKLANDVIAARQN